MISRTSFAWGLLVSLLVPARVVAWDPPDLFELSVERDEAAAPEVAPVEEPKRDGGEPDPEGEHQGSGSPGSSPRGSDLPPQSESGAAAKPEAETAGESGRGRGPSMADERGLGTVGESEQEDGGGVAVESGPGHGVQVQAGPGPLIEEFELDEEEIVVAAVKSRTTVQEAPGIVTVLTPGTIRAHGFRTINDLLGVVPGFEPERFGSNGWYREPLTRGNPGTLLILWNGVPLNEPARNIAVLDRKIPLDILGRVEVTSSPGGVLWGSNALLGVVNLLTRGPRDGMDRGELPRGGDGDAAVEVSMGLGGGPGEQDAVRAVASLSRMFTRDFGLYSNLYLFSSQGPRLEVPEQKLVGVLPAPAPDGPTFFLAEDGKYVPGVTDGNSRDTFFLWSGRLELSHLTLDWMVPWEEDYRQLATGGALLVDSSTPLEVRKHLETKGKDQITALSLGYSQRFSGDRFGLALKAYRVSWNLYEDPFGVFPPSPALPQGAAIALFDEKDQARYGLNLDSDLRVSDSHHLVFGGEVFREVVEGMKTRATDGRCAASMAATGEPVHSFDDVPYGSGEWACTYTEPIVFDSTRFVAAGFLTDEWRVHPGLTLFGGVRLQTSDTYDPTLLGSASMVWNPAGKTFFKLNYAKGLRPPYFTATHVNSRAHSSVTYQANEDLGVETSRSVDTEVDFTVLEGAGPVDSLSFRVGYGHTILQDLIGNPGGRFQNSGERQIDMATLSSRLRLGGGHELWGSYTFLEVVDSTTGPVRQVANQVAHLGAKARVWGQVDVSTLVSWIGPREDLNRDPALGRPGDAFVPGSKMVGPTDLVVDEIPGQVLWRAGARARELLGVFDLSVYVYDLANLLWGATRMDPDLYFDDRVLTRPQPREGWSFLVELEARL